MSEFIIDQTHVHTHPISDIVSLQSSLDGKAALVHTHVVADTTGLQTALDGKAALVHTHAIADTTGLQTALDGKAALVHTHTISGITDILGKQPIWIPASSITPSSTNGATANSIEVGSGKPMIVSLDFDPVTEQYATFDVQMPPGSWDVGTLTFLPVVSHPTTSVNFGIVFRLQGQAFSSGDSLDSAYSGGVTSTLTGGTANVLYRGPESSALTVANSPALGDVVSLRVTRLVNDAGDTLAVNARLHGFLLTYVNSKTREN